MAAAPDRRYRKLGRDHRQESRVLSPSLVVSPSMHGKEGFWGDFFKVHFCPLQEIVAWVRHRSCKNISTDSYRCWYNFVCLNCSMAVGVWDFNMRTDIDACDCTRGLYGPCKRVYAESWLWEKNPLPHQGLKSASVLCLGFQPAAVPTVAVAIILTPWHLSFYIYIYIYKSDQSIFSFLSYRWTAWQCSSARTAA